MSTRDEVIQALRQAGNTWMTIGAVSSRPRLFGKGRAMATIRDAARQQALASFAIINKESSDTLLNDADRLADASHALWLKARGDDPKIQLLEKAWLTDVLRSAHPPEAELPMMIALLMSAYMLVSISHVADWEKSKTRQLHGVSQMALKEIARVSTAIIAAEETSKSEEVSLMLDQVLLGHPIGVSTKRPDGSDREWELSFQLLARGFQAGDVVSFPEDNATRQTYTHSTAPTIQVVITKTNAGFTDEVLTVKLRSMTDLIEEGMQELRAKRKAQS